MRLDRDPILRGQSTCGRVLDKSLGTYLRYADSLGLRSGVERTWTLGEALH
jgi:hypothetical protein